MREIKFLAGLGTIFVFIGIFCFKAVFQKEIVSSHGTKKKSRKGLMIFLGSISSLLGVLLILLSIKKVV